jgi:tetratricopeptide (TPR) repeat protein
VAAAVVLSFGVAAHSQAAHWRDSLSLYSRAVEISPTDVAMLFNLGNAVQTGERAAEAEGLYRRALAIRPAHSPSELNLAELLREGGASEDRAESTALYQSVLRARPGNRRALAGLEALAGSAP